MTRDLRPDVVLMDIRMPELDGIEATRRILAQNHEPKPCVLILGVRDRVQAVVLAYEAGIVTPGHTNPVARDRLG